MATNSRLLAKFSHLPINSLSRRFADLETDELANRDLISQLFGNAGDVLLQGHFGILFNEALIQQAMALVKFLQLSFDNLGHGLGWFIFHLLSGNFFFLGQRNGVGS